MMRWAVVFFAAVWTQLATAQTWEFLYEVDGIKVFASSQENLQCYRAEGVIEANVFELMAVIADLSRRPEWVRNLESSTAIEGDIASSVLLYERYNFPWPASDRDTITQSNTKVDYQK